ncbi:c-type cytochrome [Acetobacter senegalensis]|uniref:c-type cytochrome n=1 Tax=Acetobacter senegalensis TaxID=446692 RepID=UPI00128D254C|nr:cytochrome c [Acetobacter senegalensis]MCG4258390.1 cytochrome c [Acetobacter senegalensis]MCG4268316.1 cytochrome c [Acetobacter senegalensis]MPQ72933.1 c-type cytochrome [Acetobacter senegalensis]
MMSFHSTRSAFLAVGALSLLLGGCSPKSPKNLYGSNCGICHHSGDGMPGSVPPLVGRLDRIASTPEGRKYLADVLMNGVSGPIMANGMPYEAEMPPFRYLKDDEVAQILSWLSARGSTQPAPVMTKEDIAAARAVRKSAGMVAEERENLNKLSPIP